MIKPNSPTKQNRGTSLHHQLTLGSHKQRILNVIRNWIVSLAKGQSQKEQLEANLFKVHIFWVHSCFSWKIEEPIFFQPFLRINKWRNNTIQNKDQIQNWILFLVLPLTVRYWGVGEKPPISGPQLLHLLCEGFKVVFFKYTQRYCSLVINVLITQTSS